MEMPHRLKFEVTPPPAPAWDRHLDAEVAAEAATHSDVQGLPPLVGRTWAEPMRQSDPGDECENVERGGW